MNKEIIEFLKQQQELFDKTTVKSTEDDAEGSECARIFTAFYRLQGAKIAQWIEYLEGMDVKVDSSGQVVS